MDEDPLELFPEGRRLLKRATNDEDQSLALFLNNKHERAKCRALCNQPPPIV